METGQDVYHFLAVIVFTQLVLLSVFLLVHKKEKKLSNRILVVFLSAKALAILNWLFAAFGVRIPHVHFVFAPVVFLLGPALYFYARSWAEKDFRMRGVHALHGLPSLLSALYFTLAFHVKSAAEKTAFLESLAGSRNPGIVSHNMALTVQEGIYLLAALGVLGRFRRELEALFSSTERIGLGWLRFVLFGFLALWSVNVAVMGLWWAGITLPFLNYLKMGMLVFFYNAMVFQGLRQPEIFNGLDKQKKYEHSKLTEAEKEKYLSRLKEHMEREKPHLDPSLTLSSLARALSLPPRYLSQILNESLGSSFFDFVNAYRVEEAKRLLSFPGANGGNILALLLEAGFQTKSVFNRVFKKHTRMTPSEFRRQVSGKAASPA